MGARPVWRVRDRASFVALRRAGRRGRRGPVSVVFVPPADGVVVTPPRVAFAVGRGVGSAVARNRLRRRLRAVVDDVARSGGAVVAPGAYLVSARPEALTATPAELRRAVLGALDAATAAAAGAAR